MLRNLTFRCDRMRHRVIVSDAAGTVRLAFGGRGSQPGAFDMPMDVVRVKPAFFGELLFPDVDADDVEPWIAVADYGNRRVQVFELDGALVGVIDLDRPGAASGRPCRLRWCDPLLEVEGVDGARTRVNLGAVLTDVPARNGRLGRVSVFDVENARSRRVQAKPGAFTRSQADPARRQGAKEVRVGEK